MIVLLHEQKRAFIKKDLSVISIICSHNPRQGSYRSWKTWKVMEFDNLDSRPGKSWNFGPGPGKSWNFMLANLYGA